MDLRYFKDTTFDFFISHNSKTTKDAWELYDILHNEFPESNIFFDQLADENGNPRFNVSENNDQFMNEATAASKIFIFIARSQEDTFEGSGNMPVEINFFKTWQNTRLLNGRPQYNLAHFGIFLCDNVDFNDTRNLFNTKSNHYIYGSDGKIGDHKNEIIDRINQIFDYNKRFANDYATTILDMVEKYYSKTNEFFNVENYIDPTLSDKADGLRYNLDEFYEQVENNNTIILGENGGIGKTSLLKMLFKHFLQSNSSLVPIWIDAKELCDNNDIFARYIERELIDPNILLNKFDSSSNLEKLITAFKKESDEKSFLFLIDGLNEVSPNIYNNILEKLKDIVEKYKACRFVVSSRGGNEDLTAIFDKSLQIEALNKEQIKTYLRENLPSHNPNNTDPTFYKILGIPMYLMLYCKTSGTAATNKGQLINNFFKSSAEKATAEQDIMLNHLLPFIAYNMVKKGDFDVRLSSLTEYILLFREKTANNPGYLNSYDISFKKQLKQLPKSTDDFLDIDIYTSNFIDYVEKSCKLFRKKDEENVDDPKFEFIHQIYRDFLCSFFILESIKRYAKNGCDTVFDIYEQKTYEKDIREFTGDLLLLSEGKPYLDKHSDEWDYSCNDKSTLLKALYRTKNTTTKNAAYLISNLVMFLDYTRKGDLTGLDFSELDLTETDIKLLVFSRRYKGKLYTTTFKNAKINTENLLCETNFFDFTAACVNDKNIATIDSSGALFIWERNMFSSNPIHKFEGLNYGIKKLRFSEDNSVIYAMTSDEILKIEYISQFKVEKVYKSEEALQNFFLEDGEIYFTTIFNPFNKKNINNPDAEDEVDFRYLTSVATVNKNKDTLVFADKSGFNGLKIYKKQDGKFVEKKWGYTRCLQEYTLEVEELLKYWGIYKMFPSDNKDPDARKTYFINKEEFFSDRNHDYHIGISKFAEKIEEVIKIKDPKFLTPEKKEELDFICQKYVDKVLDYGKKYPKAIKLTGRKILSADMSSDGETVLLSTLLNYKRDNYYVNNWALVEFNTETFECRDIAFTSLKTQEGIVATYNGEEIITLSNRSVVGYDKERNLIRKMNTKDISISSVVLPEGADVFYILAQNYIYEVSLESGKISHAIPCHERYNKRDVAYCCEKNNPETTGFRLSTNEDSSRFITTDGIVKTLKSDELQQLPTTTNEKSRFVIESGDLQYKITSKKIIRYKNGYISDEKHLWYKMFVSGCDFTGISGDITENNEAIKTLLDYSAKTDFEYPADNVTGVYNEAPSCNFELPRQALSDAPATPADICYSDSINLTSETTVSKSNKDMLRVAANFTNYVFDYTDYFFLTWIHRLQFVNFDMLLRLAQAFFPEKDENILIDKINNWLETFIYDLEFIGINKIELGTGYDIEFFPLTEKGGAGFIFNLLKEKRQNPIYKMDKVDIIKRLAVNDWFTKLIGKHKDLLTFYKFSTILDSEKYCDARANIDAIIKTDNAELILLVFRSNYTPDEIVEKLKRVKLIASDYTSISSSDKFRLDFHGEPRLIALCENYQQCVDANIALRQSDVDFNPLFAYDNLTTESNNIDFIEFDGDNVYGLTLN